jgi:xylan 1,4-beta-xylosidase
MNLTGLPREVLRVTHYRIDREHSNSYAAWQRMGSPIAPDKSAFDALRSAAQLATLAAPTDMLAANGKAQLTFLLPRQGVSLLVFSTFP